MLYVEQDAPAREFCFLDLDEEGFAKEITVIRTKQTYMLPAIAELNPHAQIKWKHKNTNIENLSIPS